MRWIVVVLFLSCSLEVALDADADADLCEDWTWIDEESCSADVCAEQDQEFEGYECRDGVCWCCFGEECWEG
jgi:hypothetical protein